MLALIGRKETGHRPGLTNKFNPRLGVQPLG